MTPLHPIADKREAGVDVIQADRDAAKPFFNEGGPAYPQLVQAFARHRATAEQQRISEGVQAKALEEAAGLALMYLESGFLECSRCGHEEPTANLDAAYELRDALISSPVAPDGESTGITPEEIG